MEKLLGVCGDVVCKYISEVIRAAAWNAQSGASILKSLLKANEEKIKKLIVEFLECEDNKGGRGLANDSQKLKERLKEISYTIDDITEFSHFDGGMAMPANRMASPAAVLKGEVLYLPNERLLPPGRDTFMRSLMKKYVNPSDTIMKMKIYVKDPGLCFRNKCVTPDNFNLHTGKKRVNPENPGLHIRKYVNLNNPGFRIRKKYANLDQPGQRRIKRRVYGVSLKRIKCRCP